MIAANTSALDTTQSIVKEHSFNPAFPVDNKYPVSSLFGARKIAKGSPFHKGIDIACGMGAVVHAMDSATVISATTMTGYGLVVILDHGNGIQTLYAHLSKILVRKGQKVLKGDVIGKSGNTGIGTGPHLHVTFLEGGREVDPVPFFSKEVIRTITFKNLRSEQPKAYGELLALLN
jgi:murein DD-endopeptidase MepM/ murein hydrolase activator NlpD